MTAVNPASEIPPPFDPPYFTTATLDGASTTIETLADGTTRVVAVGERIAPSVTPAASGAGGRAGAARPGAGKAPAPANALLLLEVPFADKDRAKKIGARWDGARKKWYVPQGGDADLFKAWWPKT
jgi:hypothetical protein